jgi:CHRD domain
MHKKGGRKMKTFRETILMFSAFLALSGIAYADGLEFKARLTGDQEVRFPPDVPPDCKPPCPVVSPATAQIEVEFDKGFTELDVDLRVRNTLGKITRAHFHCAKPGANGPIVFGLFVPGPFPVSDRVNGTLTNADYTGADCVPTTGRVINNLASLAFAMRDGLIYANVHTDMFPMGELRGQMIEVTDDKDHKFHRDDKR